MNDRYFTRDCPACPFWDEHRCTVTAECSTFEDLFTSGTFYSAHKVLQMCDVEATADFQLQGGFYIDCDGVFIREVSNNAADVARYIGENRDVVGILMPETE